MPQDSLAVVSFPFDLFGNAGCGSGASLLTDVVREIVDDTFIETRPTRADDYADRVMISEFTFETAEAVANWRATADQVIQTSLKKSPFTLWLGGNHLSVLPVYEALGDGDLVIQFDAHLDIFDLHDTTEHLSHGNFLLHAAKLPKVVNVGHRDLLIPEKLVRKIFRDTFSSAELAADGDAIRKKLQAYAAKAKRIWIDLDADAFDPAYCPAVHQRAPFGLAPLTILNLLESVWSEKVIGFSISEFDPGRDVNETSLNLLGWLVEWVLLKSVKG